MPLISLFFLDVYGKRTQNGAMLFHQLPFSQAFDGIVTSLSI